MWLFAVPFSAGGERRFRQPIVAFSQHYLNDAVYVDGLAHPNARRFIARLPEGLEQAGKTIEVCDSVHGAYLSLPSPSPWSPNQELRGLNPSCDVRHWWQGLP